MGKLVDPKRHPSEADLVAEFCDILSSSGAHPWGQLRFTREFDYARGRTDVIAVDDDHNIVAFEAKLERWRDALHQAYRNTSFAHQSYILVPEAVAARASRYAHEFGRRAVGICFIKDGTVRVGLQARDNVPVLPWLSRLAVNATRGQDGARRTDA